MAAYSTVGVGLSKGYIPLSETARARNGKGKEGVVDES